MISAKLAQTNEESLFVAQANKVRRAAQSDEALVFTDIYQEDVNIAIWQRELSETLKLSVNDFVQSNPTFQTAIAVTPQNTFASLETVLGDTADMTELRENIAELVDMFACLFALKRVGLRMSVLQHAMCPKFHVDKVPARLVTTYQGTATEWLPHQTVNRTKLGVGSDGKPDSQSGLYQHHGDIQKLNAGYVALLKGETWEGNERAGLVHRSPSLLAGEHRLLLTLDFSD